MPPTSDILLLIESLEKIIFSWLLKKNISYKYL